MQEKGLKTWGNWERHVTKYLAGEYFAIYLRVSMYTWHEVGVKRKERKLQREHAHQTHTKPSRTSRHWSKFCPCDAVMKQMGLVFTEKLTFFGVAALCLEVNRARGEKRVNKQQTAQKGLRRAIETPPSAKQPAARPSSWFSVAHLRLKNLNPYGRRE